MAVLIKTRVGCRRAQRVTALAAMVVPLGLWSAQAQAVAPTPDAALKLLGKNVFFDTKMSVPANKQACVSCHDPAWGWTLPNSKINATTVVAPGAAPHAIGNIKTPTNPYAFYSPPFRQFPQARFAPFYGGGNFWDGRAEGCGATVGQPCPVGGGRVSETIRKADLPTKTQEQYKIYLGPTADQALNPFPNTVEQNIREKNVCQVVKTAKYKKLFNDAFGEDINCNTNPKGNPAYHISFKQVAVAVAAWQASPEVNSFSSRRDTALEEDKKVDDGHFPLVGFTDAENRGHDLFYGKAACSGCHNGVPLGEAADPNGEADHQLYTDNNFHNIGVPFNRQVPGLTKGEKVGLSSHVINLADPNLFKGMFKVPTLRNVDKRPKGSDVKAYAHNGYFKSLAGIVHFYNTRDLQPDQKTPTPRCETLGYDEATEAEALEHKCWPKPEFSGGLAPPNIVGGLGLNDNEEADIVAYLETLSDTKKVTAP